MASGSTVAGVVQTGDISVMEYPVSTVTASDAQPNQLSVQTGTTRAQAASRTEDRKTLEDVQDLVAAASDQTTDPNAEIDVTPTVSSTERSQKDQQAQIWISEQKAIESSRIQAEAEAEAALAEAERIRLLGVVVEPIQGKYKLSARYGQRGGLWSAGWHTGLDFRVKTGTPVVAAANGKIISAGWGGAYGYRIEIDHGNGVITTYNHLSKIEKDSGKVVAGQEIGKSGSTGNTTGPHLHFEVTEDGEFTNPSTWLWGN